MNSIKKLNPIRRFKYMFGIYNRKNKDMRILRAVIWFVIITIPVTLFLLRAEQRLSSVALRLAAAQLENEIADQCNRTVSELLKQHHIDTDTVISTNKDGTEISSLSTNFSGLNLIKADLISQLTNQLKSSSPISCYVPVGALFSDNIMAAWGFKLPTRIITTGTARVDFFDDFDSAGINQTRYRLMLRITVSAKLHTISDYTEKEIITDIPIAETITVGDVPQFNMGNVSP